MDLFWWQVNLALSLTFVCVIFAFNTFYSVYNLLVAALIIMMTLSKLTWLLLPSDFDDCMFFCCSWWLFPIFIFFLIIIYSAIFCKQIGFFLYTKTNAYSNILVVLTYHKMQPLHYKKLIYYSKSTRIF